jgi:hypothetical protein
VADGSSVLDISLALKNNDTDAVSVQGWSYGLKLSAADLAVVDLVSSPTVTALNGAMGPDFKAYSFTPLQHSSDGLIKGITVGVVITLDGSEDALALPAGGSAVLEVLKVKSARTISLGQPDLDTTIEFISEVLPGDRPVENIITVNGLSITPKKDSPSLTITLTAPSIEPRFKRGLSNPDNRLDIADGIWTIRVLIYREGRIGCLKAADINDDGRLDLSDAVFTFNYLLQPGKNNGDTLYPGPGAPFPACGTDPTPDTLTCEEPTSSCR